MTDVADLYRLTATDLEKLDKLQEKYINNLLNAINNSRTNSVERSIFGLGIRHVGGQAARILAEHFGSLDEHLAADTDTVADIPNIGHTIAEAVDSVFKTDTVKKLVETLRSAGVNLRYTGLTRPAVSDSFVSGQTVVNSGQFAEFSRPELTKRLEQLGDKVTGTVSKKTDLDFAGDAAGRQLTQAQDLNVLIMDETALLTNLKN